MGNNSMAIIPYVNDYSKDVNELGQRPEFVGVTENPANGSIAIPVVYGARRVEGIRMWTQVSAVNQSIMYCAYALSEGWCNGVTQLLIDDKKVALTSSDFQHRIPKLVTSGAYAGVLEIEFVDGRGPDEKGYTGDVQNYGASTLIQRDFGQTYYWERVCYIVCKFTYVANGAYTQFPKVSVDMEGRKIPNWDFPSPSINTSTYSTNPTAIIWDLMSNTIYGRGINKEDIDIDSFNYVRDKCNLIRPNLTVSQPIYSCNWICNTDSSVLSNINLVLETFQLNLSYIQTKWTLTAEHAPGAAPSSNPNFKFTESNILGTIQVQYPNISERYNRVIVEHLEPTSNYQTQSTQFPLTNLSTYLTDDNDLSLVRRIQTNLITNRIIANDIAQMTLLRSRNQVTYRFTATNEAYQLRIGDLCVINVSLPWTINEPAVIISMIMNPDNTIDLECISYNASWYPNAFTNTITAPTTIGTIPTTPTPSQTWSITSNRQNEATGNTVLEGESITWTITTVGISNGTLFNWTIAGLNANDLATGNLLTGQGTISSNTATVTIATRFPNTINGDRVFSFNIGAITNPTAKWQGVLRDNQVTTPTTSFTYTFANAKPLTDNPAWYLGWTTPNDSQVFYWAKTASGSTNSLATQLGHNSTILLNANGTLSLDMRLGLIDRRSDQQGFVKNLYAVWSGNPAAAVPTPLGYRKQGSTTGVYGRETYVYNPESPPIPVSPQLAKLTPNASRTVNDEIIYAGTAGNVFSTANLYTGTIPLIPVPGKTGQYELSVPIRHLMFLNFNSIAGKFWPTTNGNPAYFSHDDITSATGNLDYTVAFFQHSPTNNVFTYIGKTSITIGTNNMTRNNDPQLALSSWLNDSRGQWINRYGTSPSAPPF